MSLADLLVHRWRALVRAPRLQSRVVGYVVAAFLALYGAGFFVLAGVFLDDLVRGIDEMASPTGVVNRWLVPVALAYLLVRVFVEGGPSLAVRPYLHLPIPRARLRRFVAMQTVASLYTLLPLLFFVPFWLENVAFAPGASGPAGGWAGAALYAAGWTGGLAMLALGVALVRAAVGAAPVGTLAGLGALGALTLGAPALGAPSLADASAWLFDGLLAARPLPALGAAGALAAVARAYRARLDHALALDADATPLARRRRLTRRRTASRHDAHDDARPDAPWTVRRVQAELVRLEWRLVTRHRRTQVTIALVAFWTLMLSVWAWIGLFEEALLAPGGSFVKRGNLVNAGLFGIAGVVIFVGQETFSYVGRRLDGLWARGVAPQTLMAAKLTFLQGVTLALAVLPMLVALVRGHTGFLLFIGALTLYTLGWGAPLVLGVAAFNRRAPDLSTVMDVGGAASASGGFVVLHLALMLSFIALPAVLLFAVPGRLGLALVAGLGGGSLLATPLWRRALGWHLARQRYAMLDAFRERG